MAYLLTHSLLASWKRSLAGNPYEDATTERNPADDFYKSLCRVPLDVTEAMQDGMDFENAVTTVADGGTCEKWTEAAGIVADIVRDGQFQFVGKQLVTIAGMKILLYGRLDVLKAGTIYDIKFTRNYDRGKFFDSTQHPMYFELIPEATDFTYIVSNGSDVWTETYTRSETPSILPVAADFLGWLRETGFMDIYKKHWEAL